ncbi:hypothetical protein ACEPAH_4076 [Sanghuangporus vaninii]
MALGVSDAMLIAILLEAVLFGGFTVFYGIALYTSVPKSGSRLNQIILDVATGMYALALSHLAIDIQRIINAFVRVSDTKRSDAHLSKPSDPLYVTQISVYTVQTILGDAFMSKLVTAPAILCFLGSIAVGIGGPHYVSRALPGDVIYVAKVKHWGTAFYAITLVTNFICTVLIALRIWWIGHHSSTSFKSRSLSPILAIIIESGAVYSATLIAIIVTYTIRIPTVSYTDTAVYSLLSGLYDTAVSRIRKLAYALYAYGQNTITEPFPLSLYTTRLSWTSPSHLLFRALEFHQILAFPDPISGYPRLMEVRLSTLRPRHVIKPNQCELPDTWHHDGKIQPICVLQAWNRETGPFMVQLGLDKTMSMLSVALEHHRR